MVEGLTHQRELGGVHSGRAHINMMRVESDAINEGKSKLEKFYSTSSDCSQVVSIVRMSETGRAFLSPCGTRIHQVGHLRILYPGASCRATSANRSLCFTVLSIDLERYLARRTWTPVQARSLAQLRCHPLYPRRATLPTSYTNYLQ